jgi:alkylation response protein AidB-like acyl-CoA dehydrogenase
MHGSPELQDRLLRPTFTGQLTWCQLFSEPSAGSDLASLQTRAVKDGDHWVVTGQKVWSTQAHLADRAMLLARTDPSASKYSGITYFALDMRVRGVEIRPLRQITGEAIFNEVFLNEVCVPDSDRVGRVGDGWSVAMTTLRAERETMAATVSQTARRGGGSIAEAVRIFEARRAHLTPAHRDRLMSMWIRAEVIRLTHLRMLRGSNSGQAALQGSLVKLMSGESNQATYDLCVDLLGAAGLIGYDYAVTQPMLSRLVGPPGSARKFFLRSLSNTIAGGTSEIQRNIISERILGLPREPHRDP